MDDDAGPAELAELRFGQNMRDRREKVEMSQTALAQQMTAMGWSWRQPTVSSVESGQRMVRLGEAKAVAEILDTSLDELTRPTEEAREVELLAEWVTQVRLGWGDIEMGTEQLLNARARLRAHPAVASPEPRQAAGLARVAQEAQRVLALTPEGAVAQGIAQIARSRTPPGTVTHAATITIRPRTIADADAIADALREGEVVILDLTTALDQDVQRLVDWVTGATRVRGGSVTFLEEGKGDDPLKGVCKLVPAERSGEWTLILPPPGDRDATGDEEAGD